MDFLSTLAGILDSGQTHEALLMMGRHLDDRLNNLFWGLSIVLVGGFAGTAWELRQLRKIIKETGR
jgi:hypothetical protein